MIEVEKKYYTNKKIYDFLYHECEFKGEKIIEDKYYDTQDFQLALKNTWFRNRNGSFEIKVPTKEYNVETNTFHEYEVEEDIKNALPIKVQSLSHTELLEAGYFVFLEFQSLRKKFKYKDFTIDLDETNFDLELLEFELLVETEEEVEEAVARIVETVYAIDPEATECKIGKGRHLIIENYPELDKKMVQLGNYPPLEL